MATLDLSEVVSDPDLAEPFQILRSQGGFVAGGFASQETPINAYGVVSVANEKDLEELPEGDRVREGLVFHSTQQMYTTNAKNAQLSDVLVWQDTQYRVLKVANYSQRGYWRAIASRLLGN